MKKFTQEEVADVFLKFGYRILEPYIDCKTKIQYSCPVGHVSAMTYDNFKRGKRCPRCRIEEARKRYQHSYEFVKHFFEDNNCTLLEEKYTNGKQLLRYRCSCGNVAKIRFNDFQSGERCGACAAQRRAGKMSENNLIPVSAQQDYQNSLYGGTLNYLVRTVFLDIAFPEEKIYIEYDGSGHDLSVKIGSVEQADFDEKQKRRTYGLYRNGWRCMRIISKKDKLPSDIVLKNMLATAKNLFCLGHSYCIYNIDEQTMEYHGETFDVNFGELHRIRKFDAVTTECRISNNAATVDPST